LNDNPNPFLSSPILSCERHFLSYIYQEVARLPAYIFDKK
jgi:hypothetical protein